MGTGEEVEGSGKAQWPELGKRQDGGSRLVWRVAVTLLGPWMLDPTAYGQECPRRQGSSLTYTPPGTKDTEKYRLFQPVLGAALSPPK